MPRVFVAQSLGGGFVLTDAELWRTESKPIIKDSVLDFCSREMRMVPDDATVAEAVNVMSAGEVRMLPIVHKFTREVVGVVSARGILKHLTWKSPVLEYDEYEMISTPSKGSIMSAMNSFVIDISEKESVVASKHLSIVSALNLMVQKQIGYMPVVDEHLRPVCVLAEYALAEYASKVEEFDAMVGDFVRTPVSSISNTSRIRDACKRIIETAYRRVPVVNEQEEIVGVVTVSSLLSLFNQPESKSKFATGRQDEVLNTLTIDIMQEKVIETAFDERVIEAGRKMKREGVNALYVKDKEGKLEAIFTEWDVLRAYSSFLGTKLQ